MKGFLRSMLFFALAISLVGCGTPPKKLNTTSGNPEITISGVTKKQVIDLIVEGKLSDGFELKSVNDYSVVVGRDVDDFAAKVAYGSDYDRTPEARSTYNLVKTATGVKVFVRSEMITNPDSQYEKRTDVTRAWGEYAQAELERIKIMLEKK